MAKRKKAAEPQPTEVEVQVTTQGEASDPATEFNPAKLETTQPTAADPAARIAAALAAAPVIRASELETTAVAATRKPAEASSQREQVGSKLPDPHSIEQISLTGERNGAMMRLFRNHRYRSLAIKFDEKPSAEITQQLKDNGWSWRSQDKVWVKPLEHGNEWRIVADAEKQFRAIGNQLREARGLEPVARSGVGAA